MSGDAKHWPKSSDANEANQIGVMHFSSVSDEPPRPGELSVRVGQEFWDDEERSHVVLNVNHPLRPGMLFRLSLHEAHALAAMLQQATVLMQKTTYVGHSCRSCGNLPEECCCEKCPRCGFAASDCRCIGDADPRCFTLTRRRN